MAGAGDLVNVAHYAGSFADPRRGALGGYKTGSLGCLVVTHFVDGKPITKTTCAGGPQYVAAALRRSLSKGKSPRQVDLRFNMAGSKHVAAGPTIYKAVRGVPPREKMAAGDIQEMVSKMTILPKGSPGLKAYEERETKRLAALRPVRDALDAAVCLDA